MTLPVLLLVGVAILLAVSVWAGAPYVPSHKSDINLALTKLYKVSNKDTLVDVGSGDGIVLRIAAKRGARAIGYEINPVLALLSRLISVNNPQIAVRLANFLKSDMPENATVVYLFSVRLHIDKYIRHIQDNVNKHGRPLVVISYGLELPGLKPAKQIEPYMLYRFKPLQKKKA